MQEELKCHIHVVLNLPQYRLEKLNANQVISLNYQQQFLTLSQQ